MISRSRSTRNFSGNIRSAPAGPALFFPGGIVSRTQPQRPRRGRVFKASWTITAKANLPDRQLMAWRKFFSTQKDYAGRASAVSSRGGEVEGSRPGAFRALFRSALSGKSRPQRRSREALSAGYRGKNPNPYRDDARLAAGFDSRSRAGRKTDALKQYEALANETGKPALKAEATVRAGLVAVDLQRDEKGKTDKAMTEKATALLQKGAGDSGSRTLARDRGDGIVAAAISVRRNTTQLLAEYKRGQEQIPEDARAEMMLLAGTASGSSGTRKRRKQMYRADHREISQPRGSEGRAVSAADQHLQFRSARRSCLRWTNSLPPIPPRTGRSGEAAEGGSLLQTGRTSPTRPRSTRNCARPSSRQSCGRNRPISLVGVVCRLKSPLPIIDAFSYFLKAFADNPQVPSALTQRALAYQETKITTPRSRI